MPDFIIKYGNPLPYDAMMFCSMFIPLNDDLNILSIENKLKYYFEDVGENAEKYKIWYPHYDILYYARYMKNHSTDIRQFHVGLMKYKNFRIVDFIAAKKPDIN